MATSESSGWEDDGSGLEGGGSIDMAGGGSGFMYWYARRMVVDVAGSVVGGVAGRLGWLGEQWEVGGLRRG